MISDGSLTETGGWRGWLCFCGHPARLFLEPYRLGDSDDEGEHRLLVDRYLGTLDVGLGRDVEQLLATQPSELGALTADLPAGETEALFQRPSDAHRERERANQNARSIYTPSCVSSVQREHELLPELSGLLDDAQTALCEALPPLPGPAVGEGGGDDPPSHGGATMMPSATATTARRGSFVEDGLALRFAARVTCRSTSALSSSRARSSRSRARSAPAIALRRAPTAIAAPTGTLATDNPHASCGTDVGSLARSADGRVLEEREFRRLDASGDTVNLGVVLHQRADVEDATAAYERAEPNRRPRAAFNLGVLLYEAGDLDGAEAAWRRSAGQGHARAAGNPEFSTSPPATSWRSRESPTER